MDKQITLEQMGRAALIPGMQFILDRMSAVLDEFRAALVADAQGKPKRGRPKGSKNAPQDPPPIAELRRRGWSDDPEERSKEMLRRMKVSRAKKRGANHPRNADHPDHEQWVAKMRRGNKKYWASLSPAEKKQRVDGMVASRKLEVAS